MKKPIFMGTTKIAAEKTAMEIQAVLVASGARQIASDYASGGKITGLRFIIEVTGRQVAFSLPVRTEALRKHLRGDIAQAERVAWRQLLRWAQAQLAMIDVGMVKAEEVYAPYMLQQNGQTLYELMAGQQFRALPAPEVQR
jgi:hypothetical protein